jgi:type II pantothenate kinase
MKRFDGPVYGSFVKISRKSDKTVKYFKKSKSGEVNRMKVGIDAGGSLLKLVYQENGNMHFKKFPIREAEKAITWLKMTVGLIQPALTGGKAQLLRDGYFPEGVIVPEFQATCEGARTLLFEEGRKIDEPFLLVNIGTGTSWHFVHGDQYERILGSGVGGGLFTGLGEVLTQEKNFQQLTQLAAKGDKGNVDLLVKDIYESDDPPIHGNLTAANFAKGLSLKHSESDRMAALSNLIVETIILLTLQAAAIHQTKQIVFIGSTLIGNVALKDGLEFYMNKLGLSFLFLPNGEYCGALGALLTV